ncbi:MAG: GntR family transcriptional regulator, partial [Deltaproteobacteria bacterium]|nr:GntR family transcriptional regulator [Deltaproteobacteria bacterium]
MLIKIDPQSAEPIFEQIVFQVKGSVARGELLQGDRLPSVRELAKELSVNPNTVIRAYEALEKSGAV